MRNRELVLLAVVLLAGCSGNSTDPNTRLAHGIVAGQNQTSIAGTQSLGSGVTELMVRNSTGQISFHRVDPIHERLLDLLATRAFAQTVVNGSPVAGAVVCAAGGDGGLTPFVPCTNTGVDGKATFFFTPTTASGNHTSEIRGTVAGEPAVFDTAKATVIPDAPNANYRSPNPGGPIVGSPAVIADLAMVDRFGNPIPFRIVSDGTVSAQDTVPGTIGARTLVFTTSTVKNGSITEQVTELRGTGGVLVGRFGYTISAALKLTGWRSVGSALTIP